MNTQDRRTKAGGIKKSGKIWEKHLRARASIIRKVCNALDREYRNDRHGNPRNPLDDLVYIVLSNKTTPSMARQVYSRIQERFKTWEKILTTPPSVLRSFLKPAGLARVKANQIRDALKKIRFDFGKCNLNSLRLWPSEKVHEYLISLSGVSDKVSKCVMMYTLNARVLPVDTHVHRVATRLGWTARKRADQCHNELEALVPEQFRYSFHVNSISHGRKVCRSRQPLCQECIINEYCDFFKKNRC